MVNAEDLAKNSTKLKKKDKLMAKITSINHIAFAVKNLDSLHNAEILE